MNVSLTIHLNVVNYNDLVTTLDGRYGEEKGDRHVSLRVCV